MTDTKHLRDPRDTDWRTVLLGWLIGLAALVLLLLSVTGSGTGPAGIAELRNILWVWAAIILFAAAWYILLRGLPWPSPFRRGRTRENKTTDAKQGLMEDA